MLSLQESVTIFVQEASPRAGEAARSQFGIRQYERARRQGKRRRLLNRLAGRSTRLRDLSAELLLTPVKARHSAPSLSVLIDQIRGSESRSQDFDADFYPLGAHTDDRWIAIAAAVRSGIALPPVELIRLGDVYYVRDGHHRVSVARALGQQSIDANITVYEL